MMLFSKDSKLLVVLISILVCFVIIGIAEVYSRLFTDVILLGSSSSLYIENAYGPSRGHAKNAVGVSYEVEIHTDENGFRIDPNYKDSENYASAVLIMGDSVAFGMGVRESKTFAGLPRKELPDTRIYNSAVIGYDIEDYRNMIDYFALKHKVVLD